MVPPLDPIASLRTALRGHYEIEREIGQGAFATVYLARDLKHERKVALKVLHADASSETGEIRFIREIRLLARLQHPNILPLHDSGHVESLLYYVMPYVSGETLRDRIHRERRLPIETACSIARDAADALAYAHAQGIIHRDIKPENILLSAGHPILADFGIARAIDLAGVRQLTHTGMGSPGTPAYMSPEQLIGDQELDGRSDTYSLGCVLYEMLTGKPPFAGKEGFVKRFTEPPPTAVSLRPELPQWVDAAVQKALARAPADRYQSAKEFVTALRPPGGTGAFKTQPAATSVEAVKLPVAPAVGPLTPTVAPAPVAQPHWFEPKRWVRAVATHPQTTAAFVAGIVIASFAFRNTVSRLSGAFGAGTFVDSTRIAVLPLSGTAPLRDRNRVGEGIYSALSDWRGLNLTSDQDVADAVRADGAPTSTRAALALARKLHARRFIWGQITQGDSLQTRLQLYDVAADTPFKSVSLAVAGEKTQLAQATRELLEAPGRPPAANGGDGRTTSFPAWTAYGAGHIAADSGDLPTAERAFRDAAGIDPSFGPARVWLAQVLAWKSLSDRQDWRDDVAQGLRAESGLSARDRLVGIALSQLADKRYPEACATYSQLTATDSLDFVGLYGLGQCHAFDSLVVPSASSPSKWQFRARYSDAATSYMKALSVNPNAHSFFSFAALQEMLPIASTKTRRGRNAAGEEWAAYPALIRDTTVFVPYPLGEFARLPAKQIGSAQDAAIARNLDLLLDFATEWTRDSPLSAPAFRALADVLEARGEITRSRSAGISAVQAIGKARQLATTSRDSLFGAAGEAWLVFKEGDFARARMLADSVLARKRSPTTDDAEAIAGLAALTGKIGGLADWVRLTPEYAATASTVPIAVMDAAAPFFAFAALGVCGDTTIRLERRLDDQLTHSLAEDQQPKVTAVVKARPLSMLAPCTGGRSSLGIHAPGGKLLKMQQALARSDSAALKLLVVATNTDGKTQRPGDISLDFTYQFAWLMAASGDTAGAARQLDRALGSLPTLSALSLRDPASAAAAGRAMALRAEIAAARGEAEERRKWARAVTDLWANADAPLQNTVSRMRSLAAPGFKQ
jgi:tRNA A-37 threonylcarbamoyl transferase component Bud32/tetratricopeptide (TPR) repeat protein